MKTVFNKKEEMEKLTTNYPYKMEDKDTITFEVLGQVPERTIEDRSVYFTASTTIAKEKNVCKKDVNLRMWLNGEEAIELGQMLIKQGVFVLDANRTQHQLLFMKNTLKRYIEEDRVKQIVFTKLSDNFVNYGKGVKLFNIAPEWNENMEPEYNKTFNYDEVIYWSPFTEAFIKQLNRYTMGKVDYSFIGYEHDKAIAKFNAKCAGLEEKE